MAQEEIISAIIKKISTRLESDAGSRDHFFIVKWILWLTEICSGISYKKELDSRPFEQPLYYFLKSSRFEEARKFFRLALRDIGPFELIEHYLESFADTNDSDLTFNLIVFVDTLISFLVQMGYEREVIDKTVGPLDIPTLDIVLSTNWVKLFKRFHDCQRSKDCYDLFHDLSIFCNKLTTKIGQVNSIDTTVQARKWLLKRQELGLYTAALGDYFEPGYFHHEEKKEMLKIIKDWAVRTYINYQILLCHSLERYVISAKQVLKSVETNTLHYSDIPDNLIKQAKKIDRKFSDVKDFLEETTGITVTFNWAHHFIEYLEHPGFPLDSTNSLLEWIKGALDCVKKMNTDYLYGSPELNENCEIIENSIMSQGGDSFWARCKKRFNPGRLKLMAASIDNQYSTGTAYFFETPVIKLDKEKPIDTELCLLNRWGSTTGVFERNKNFSAGISGGYFLFHNGFGLAVDPGPDFLRNLTKYTDFDLMDINGIACTHTHYDHFADFNRIVLGIREYNLHAGYKKLYYLLPDQDDQVMFPEKLREDFCINVYEERATGKFAEDAADCYFLPNTAWGRKNGICIQRIEVIHEIYKDNRYFHEIKKEEVIKEYEKLGRTLGTRRNSKTIAGKDKGKRLWSYGFLLKPLKDGEPVTEILFTGDAEYEPDLFNGLNPEVLIMNCSSVRFNDIIAEDTKNPTPFSPGVKKNQLGYTGILRLLQKMDKNKLAVISDFFEAQSEMDARLFISEALRADISIIKKTSNNILVGEPGMRIRWKARSKPEFYCTPLCSESGFVQFKPGTRLIQLKKNIFHKHEHIVTSCDECLGMKMGLGLKKWNAC